MIFKWESKQEKIFKGARISGSSKLEGIRLMNELTDKVLSGRQKSIRRKLRK